MNADRREMTDTCLIVSGGPTDRKFAAEFVKNRKYPYVIAVDAGLAVCEELGLVPDLAVGDFDTFGLETDGLYLSGRYDCHVIHHYYL